MRANWGNTVRKGIGCCSEVRQGSKTVLFALSKVKLSTISYHCKVIKGTVSYIDLHPCRQDRLGFFQHKQPVPISPSTPSID